MATQTREMQTLVHPTGRLRPARWELLSFTSPPNPDLDRQDMILMEHVPSAASRMMSDVGKEIIDDPRDARAPAHRQQSSRLSRHNGHNGRSWTLDTDVHIHRDTLRTPHFEIPVVPLDHLEVVTFILDD